MLTQAQQTIRWEARMALRDAIRNLPPSEIPAFIANALKEAGIDADMRGAIGDRISGIAWDEARRA